MARLPRIGPAGIPQHVIQRGNNRQICFARDEDFSAYANWLKEYSKQFSVDVHAWVFMTNPVHLLVTPSVSGAVSKMMQALGRRYVRYFNHTYRRSGTLWEGRFKSSLVQSSDYLLLCQRYIELNPVRADMVKDPSEYIWSSYRCHGLGVISELWKPHPEYVRLGRSSQERQISYRSLFRSHVDGELLHSVRDAVNKGLALGSEKFKREIEQLHGRRLRPSVIGRPKKEKNST